MWPKRMMIASTLFNSFSERFRSYIESLITVCYIARALNNNILCIYYI